MKVYFDNAATTPILPEVVEAMQEVMISHYGNPSSIHALGRKSKALIEEARKTVAHAINASVAEVFFTSSATEANNTVIQQAITSLGVKRIISSPTEHHCITHTLAYVQEHQPVEVIYLSVDHQGNIDLDTLESLLREGTETTLVSLMYVNNEIGTIHPIHQIAQLCATHEAFFHCDAVQAIGKIPVDVQSMKIHFLSASAHKFHGPKGVGFLYMNQESILKPMIYGGAQERNFRAGTENVPGIVGLAHALRESIQHIDNTQSHIADLKLYFKQRLLALPFDIVINADIPNSAHHILSVSFPPSPKADLLLFNLDIAGICAASGSACASGVDNDSHVLQAIQHDPNRKTIRFSFSKFNTKAEVDYVVEQLSLIC